MRYVMLVNIGPVQGFIAAARRTRDLWYGSWLLSELSKSAAAAIMAKGGDLIFPAVDRSNAADLTPGSDFNVVNRVVALVDGDPAMVAGAVIDELRRLLKEQWEDALQEVSGPLDDSAKAMAQIQDLVECVWTAAPCATDDQYRSARKQAEALMAARKNTRNFTPVLWGDTRPKSSLDGQREAVIPEERYPADNEKDDARKQKIDRLYREYGAGRAERLSAVDLLKRHGGKDLAARARSTSHIAARSFLNRLQRDRVRTEKAIRSLTDTLKRSGAEEPGLKLSAPYAMDDGLLGYDGYLLYENRLRDEAEDQGRSAQQVEAALKALAAFYDSISSDPVTEKRRKLKPSPYYALLVGDGDNMGKVVDAQPTIAAHREISRRLSEFAANAKAIVRKHDGFTIYAGGDDVMAFLPLHTLLGCAAELHAAFGAAVGSYRSEPDANGAPVSPSLSIGVVIAHHIEPLSDALHLARRAEHAAKNHPGKDALAVTLSKRSGADLMIVGGWSEGMVARLRFLMDSIVDEIPEGAAYELLHMQRRLTPVHAGPAEAAAVEALPAVILLETRRILNRKRGDRGAKPLGDETMDRLVGYLAPNAAAGKTEPPTRYISVQELAGELIVANLLADAERLGLGDEFDKRKAQHREVAL